MGRRDGGCTVPEIGRLGLARNLIWQELQGDKTVQAGVFGLVDDSHAAPADFLDDAIVRNGLANH
jgi:hypothetical protein